MGFALHNMRKLFAIACVCAGASGCIPLLPMHDARLQAEREIVQAKGEVAQRGGTNLDELLAIAYSQHPDMNVARARIDSARGQWTQAGLYPNPVFGPRFSQVGDHQNALGEAGATLTQTFVTKNKLGLAREAAAQGIEAADWQAITTWYAVATRVRLAYYELLTAQRELDTLEDIVRVSEEAYKAAVSLEKAGAGTRFDILRAKVEAEQNRLRRAVSQRRVEAGRQNLLTALGRPVIAPESLVIEGRELDRSVPGFDWEAIIHCLRESSGELHELRARVAQNEKLLARARAEVTPNVDVNVVPFLQAPTRELHFLLAVTAPLPIFNRNQGNIHSAQADLVRSRAEVSQRELLLIERLTDAFRRLQAAKQQAETFAKTIVPEARESLKLVETGYRRGDVKYDYTAMLQAQQVLFQAELARTQALGEQWRAVVEIAGVLQQDDILEGCAKAR